MIIDVYDFDKTVYNGDCTVDFYKYCLSKKPWLIFLLPYQIIGLVFMKLGIFSEKKGKGMFLRFFRFINADEKFLNGYVNKYSHKINSWFSPDIKIPSIIISASPQFIVEALLNSRAHKIIGTEIDRNSGRLISLNCKGKEKIERLKAYMPDFKIRRMYTDSIKNDGFLLDLADEKYIIYRNKEPELIKKTSKKINF